MKRSHLLCVLLSSVVVISATAVAQQPRTRQGRERRADSRSASETYQLLGFTITTGNDDLRTDSDLKAHVTFQDIPSIDCPLHGLGASGAAANITWDNNSIHATPPCRLPKPMSLADLRQDVISLNLASSGVGASPDNWNVNRVVVTAYNPGTAGQTCLFSVAGAPLARLTEDQPHVAISDFPNQCR